MPCTDRSVSFATRPMSAGSWHVLCRAIGAVSLCAAAWCWASVVWSQDAIGNLDGSVRFLLTDQPAIQPRTDVPELPETVVEAEPAIALPSFPGFEAAGPTNRGDSLLGIAPAASAGVFGRDDLSTMPLIAPTNVLDLIPGFASTMENTGADAGVYYVRGVNVEHGTDFAVFVDDVPINQPTHAHAQGLANINFLIPEVIEVVEYRKGSYYADLGDFSTLGAAKIRLARTLPESINRLSAGQYGWARGVVASSGPSRGGELLYAADLSYFDNAFQFAQNEKRFKGLIKYTAGDECEGTSTSLMAYHADWFSTEPQLLSNILANGRFSNFDPTTGGRESRFSWNTEYWREDGGGRWTANVYAIYDRFDIYINPEQQQLDEQVFQPDGRLTTGVNIAREVDTCLGGCPSPWTFGLQIRDDFINRLRRDNTDRRVLLMTETSHRVNIFTVSPYVSNHTQWTDWARTDVGVRGDIFQFDVVNLLDRTGSGDRSAGLVNPKFSLVLGPWADTEYFLNLGTGFHSNDARGLFDRMMPTTALARTESAEVGLRREACDGWDTTVAVWYQEFQSEMVFDAEEGAFEARGPSRRYGVEWNNSFYLFDWLTWDVDWAWAHVRFTNGKRIPQSLSSILSTGPTMRLDNGLYGRLWFRHFSPRPLVEDNSDRSSSVEVANLEVGWRRGQWDFAVDVFNVFGSRDAAETFFENDFLPRDDAKKFFENDFLIRTLDPTQARFTLTRYY